VFQYPSSPWWKYDRPIVLPPRAASCPFRNYRRRRSIPAKQMARKGETHDPHRRYENHIDVMLSELPQPVVPGTPSVLFTGISILPNSLTVASGIFPISALLVMMTFTVWFCGQEKCRYPGIIRGLLETNSQSIVSAGDG
jgi:hypothetical protein